MDSSSLLDSRSSTAGLDGEPLMAMRDLRTRYSVRGSKAGVAPAAARVRAR